jgi:phosphoglycolate phosphatase
MQIKAILFDKDGTLFDFEASWGDWMVNAIATLSRGDDAVAAALAGVLRFDHVARRFAPDSPVIAGTQEEIVPLMAPLVPSMSAAQIAVALEHSAAAAAMVAAVPLRPLLEGFRRDDYALGVATNATLAEAYPHLDAADVTEFFDFVAGCDSGFGAKPDPGMCLAFAAHLGHAPDTVLMVGDSLHDLTAGRAAGMRTAGVLTGIAQAEDLAPFADVVLPDIGALPTWLAEVRTLGSGPPR